MCKKRNKQLSCGKHVTLFIYLFIFLSHWIKTFGGRFLHTPCIKAIKYQCKCDALLNVKKKLLNVGNMAKNNTSKGVLCSIIASHKQEAVLIHENNKPHLKIKNNP